MQIPGPLLSPGLKNKKNPQKFFYIFLKKRFPYILGKWNSYILGNGTFKPNL